MFEDCLGQETVFCHLRRKKKKKDRTETKVRETNFTIVVQAETRWLPVRITIERVLPALSGKVEWMTQNVFLNLEIL